MRNITGFVSRSCGNGAGLRAALLASSALAMLIFSADRAAAACSGVNTGTVLCDASNPATGGNLTTSANVATTVTINPGAGITGTVQAAVGFSGTGDLTFIHNDPAGLGSTSGFGLSLGNDGTGAINYTGSANVTSQLEAIRLGHTTGAVSVVQNGGVLTGTTGISLNGTNASSIAINTVGSLINASGIGIFVHTERTQNIEVTTGAVNGGGTDPTSIFVRSGFSTQVGGDIRVHAQGPLNGSVNLDNDGTGGISFTADAGVNGAINLDATGNSANKSPVTLALKTNVNTGLNPFSGVIESVTALSRGVTTVSTRNVTGGVRVSGASGSLTVDGDVTINTNPLFLKQQIAGVSAGFQTDGTVAVNGAVFVNTDQRGLSNLSSSSGAGASVGTGSIVFKGPITSAIIDDANRTTSSTGASTTVGTGTAVIEGAVTASATAGTASATGVSARGGTGSGSAVTTLNGAISATATVSGVNASTAVGLSASVNQGTHTVTANAPITATAVGTGGTATGIQSTATLSTTGALNIVANGSVSAASDGKAMGVSIIRGATNQMFGIADISVTSKGTVTATSASGAAIGMNYGFANTVADARSLTFRAEGDVIATGLAGTFGIKTAHNGVGDVTVEVLAKVQSSGSAIDMSRTTAGNMVLTTGANANVTGTTGVTTTGGTTTFTHAGKITGTGGTAIQFGGTNDVLTLIPGYGITGNVIGTGTSALQLGGTAAAAFDLSTFGAGAQYGGFGTLNSLAGSNWTLSGNSDTFAGTLNVNGLLSLNGSMKNAAFVVGAGGTLGGNGTVGNLTINGGTLSPGNSIGAITVNGNLVLGAGSIYKVEVDGATSDKTTVTGTATLDGKVTVTPIGRVTAKTTYTIINAASVSGTFTSVALLNPNNLARNPSLSYSGGNVLLTLDPGLLSPMLPAFATVNQRNVAAAIDNGLTSGRDLPAGFDGLFNLSATGLTTALGQLSGETHASTAGALVDEASYVRGAVLGRMRQGSYGGDASMAALSTGGPQTAFAEEAIETALAYAKSPIVRKAPLKAPTAASDVAFWAQGFGAWGRFGGDGSASTLRRDLAGFMTGFDARFGQWRGGVAAGYTGSQNNTDGRGSSNVETGHIAAYGGTSIGHWNVRAGGAYAFHAIDTNRTVAFPGFFDRTFARYDGGTGQVFGEVGYGVAFGNVAIEPFAGAAWVHLHTDAARERGGAAALDVAANTFEVGYSTLGVRAASMVPLGHNMVLIPRGTLAWQHAFGDVTPAATFAFVATGASFVTSGVPIARDALLSEAGLDLAIGRNATLGVSYNGQLANRVQDHAAKGKFVWRF
jgi:outer membrane autotransporter protein